VQASGSLATPSSKPQEAARDLPISQNESTARAATVNLRERRVASMLMMIDLTKSDLIQAQAPMARCVQIHLPEA